MKVGLLIYDSLDKLSGGYLYDRQLVKYLRDQGDEVQLVSLTWRNYLRHLGDNFSTALYQQLRALQVDILLQDQLNHPSTFLLNRRLREKVGFPLVAIVHHLRSSEARPDWANWWYSRVERIYLRGLNGLIYNSRTTQRTVEILSGVELPGVIAFPAGDHITPQISSSEIEERAWRPGSIKLLFVGNLIPRKGLHLVLEALSHLPPDSFELVVVGSSEFDPQYAEALQSQSRNLGLTERVRFLGRLDQEALIRQFRSSHLLVAPSSYEGFGIVYLEGMGWGLPAIATTAGATWEIITSGEDGLLVSPGEPTAIARHLDRLGQDRQELARLSLGARRKYLSWPTWEQAGGRIRAFLKTLVG
jgi:glycosyltransferase involved in cell wall biosynthesis